LAIAVGVQGHGVNDHAQAGHHVLGHVLLAAAARSTSPIPTAAAEIKRTAIEHVDHPGLAVFDDHAQRSGAPARSISESTPSTELSYQPGQLAQCDLWFPATRIPVAPGQEPYVSIIYCRVSRSSSQYQHQINCDATNTVKNAAINPRYAAVNTRHRARSGRLGASAGDGDQDADTARAPLPAEPATPSTAASRCVVTLTRDSYRTRARRELLVKGRAGTS
jgi:hypothetical protein